MAKKEGIRKLFDNIAADYDRLNHILSLNIDKGWRKKAVREIVDPHNPLKVLDVACGTGDFTIEIAEKLAAGSEIIGVDISEGMMAIGRDKIAKAGVEIPCSREIHGHDESCRVRTNRTHIHDIWNLQDVHRI